MTTQTSSVELAHAFESLHVSRPDINPDDLIEAFSHLDIPDKSIKPRRTVGPNEKYHELHLDYPAFDLLPPGATPVLYEPRNVTLRERPIQSTYHPGIGDIFVRLPTKRSAGEAMPSGLADPSSTLSDLAMYIERLKERPGISNFEVITYKENPAGPVLFSTRLTTSWSIAGGFFPITEIWTFRCTKDEWHCAFKPEDYFTTGPAWFILINDLVYRVSDRSYFSLQQRLLSTPQGRDLLASSNPERWSSKIKFVGDTRQVLFRYLQSQLRGKNTDGSGVDHDVYTLRDACGHSLTFPSNRITNLSEDECRALSCTICDRPLLQQQQKEYIEAWENIRHKENQEIKDSHWADAFAHYANHGVSLDDEMSIFSGPVTHILASLKDALYSLEVPDCIMPSEMDLIGAPETQVLCEAFGHLFSSRQGGDGSESVLSVDLMWAFADHILRDSAGIDGEADIDAVLPVGYKVFLKAWWERALIICGARG